MIPPPSTRGGPQPRAMAIILGSSFPVGHGLGPRRLRRPGDPSRPAQGVTWIILRAASATSRLAVAVEGPATVPVRPAGAAWGAVTQACGLVTGSGALVPPELSGTVGVVDLPVRIGDQRIDARSAEELRQFYARLPNGEPPETSTSSPGEFLEAYHRCRADQVLCLTIPARWSGIDDSARLAARILAEEEGRGGGTVVDTGTAAAGLGLIPRVAARLCIDGAEPPEVLHRTERAIR